MSYAQKNIIISNWMVTELQLSGNDLLIYALLFGFSRSKIGYYCGSSKHIGNSCGCSEKTVQRTLDTLIKRNLINKEKSESGKNTYNIFKINTEFVPKTVPKKVVYTTKISKNQDTKTDKTEDTKTVNMTNEKTTTTEVKMTNSETSSELVNLTAKNILHSKLYNIYNKGLSNSIINNATGKPDEGKNETAKLLRNTKTPTLQKKTTTREIHLGKSDVVGQDILGTGPKKPNLYNKGADKIYSFTQDIELQGLLVEYWKMRIAVRDKPIRGVQQWQGMLNKLADLAKDISTQKKIVAQSLEKGWLSFFELSSGKYRQNNAQAHSEDNRKVKSTASETTKEERADKLKKEGLREAF